MTLRSLIMEDQVMVLQLLCKMLQVLPGLALSSRSLKQFASLG